MLTLTLRVRRQCTDGITPLGTARQIADRGQEMNEARGSEALTDLVEVSRGDVSPSPEPPHASVGLEVPVVEVHRRAHGVLHCMAGTNKVGHGHGLGECSK